MTQTEYENHCFEIALTSGVEEFDNPCVELEERGWDVGPENHNLIKNKAETHHVRLKDGILYLVRYTIKGDENHFDLYEHTAWDNFPNNFPSTAKWMEEEKQQKILRVLNVIDHVMTQTQYEDHLFSTLNYGAEEFKDPVADLQKHNWGISEEDIKLIEDKEKTHHVLLKDGDLYLVRYTIYIDEDFDDDAHKKLEGGALRCPEACDAIQKWMEYKSKSS